MVTHHVLLDRFERKRAYALYGCLLNGKNGKSTLANLLKEFYFQDSLSPFSQCIGLLGVCGENIILYGYVN